MVVVSLYPACPFLIYAPFGSQKKKVKKSQKKSKKCFTKSVRYETLYLSRGTGPLDTVGIPPTRHIKKVGERQKKLLTV